MSDSETLTGLTACVTRPAAEAELLAERIRELQGQAIIMPVMTIVEIENAAARMKEVFQTTPDIVIFVSKNAVRITSQVMTPSMSKGLENIKVAAIGASTATTLQEQGVDVTIKPGSQSFTTEALLDSPYLQQITGFRIIIIRGQGGRARLADELQQRGADVFYCELCKRQLPASFDQSNFAFLKKSGHIVLCTSTEIMHNLLELAGTKYETIVKNTPLLVVSSRIHKEAVRLGFQSDILVSENATDQAVITRLIQWHAAKEK